MGRCGALLPRATGRIAVSKVKWSLTSDGMAGTAHDLCTGVYMSPSWLVPSSCSSTAPSLPRHHNFDLRCLAASVRNKPSRYRW